MSKVDDKTAGPSGEKDGGQGNDQKKDANPSGGKTTNDDSGKDKGDGRASVNDENLKKAFDQERAERKAAQEELEKYKAKEKELEEKKLADEGKYKDLLEKKEIELAELKGFKEKYDKYAEKADELYKRDLEKVTDEGQRETIETLLADKSPFEKSSMLPDLMQKFGIGEKKDVNKQPQAGDGNSGLKKDDIESKLAEAKKSKDTQAVIRFTRELQKLK